MKVSFAKPGTSSISQPATAAVPVAAVPVETVSAPAPATITATTSQPVTEAPATQTATALAVVTDNAGTRAVAPYTPPTPAFYDDESLDPGDLVLPRLNIVQKVGDMSNIFTHGSIILNANLVLAEGKKGSEPTDPVRILVVGFQPTIYVEKVTYGLRGNVCRTPEEVVKKNGTLDYNEAQATGKAWYQRSATAMVLIEQPKGLDAAAFPQQIGGVNYALALFTMKGTAYTNGAKEFKSALKIGHIRLVRDAQGKPVSGGYRSGFFTIQSKLKVDKNSYFIPVVKPAGNTTPEFQAELKALLGF